MYYRTYRWEIHILVFFLLLDKSLSQGIIIDKAGSNIGRLATPDLSSLGQWPAARALLCTGAV
jgi:hypothetical protein